MNMYRLTVAVTLSIICFVLFIYPDPSGIMYDILRGLSFILIVLVLYQFSLAETDDSVAEKKVPGKKSCQDDSFVLKDNLHDQYKHLITIVFNMITAINDKYHAALFMIDESSQNLNLQFSANELFKQNIKGHNNIIKTILNQQETVLIQQSDNREEWQEIFNDQSWRGSECLLGERILYKNAPVGCILIETDHFSTINERDREIMNILGKFVTFGIVKLDTIEKLSVNNYFHYQIVNLFNTITIQSEVRGLYEKIRDLCHSFFKYDKLTISVINNDQKTFRVIVEDGYTGDVKPDAVYNISGSIQGIVLRKGETIISSDIEYDFYENYRFEKGDMEVHPFRSMMAVPVFKMSKIFQSIILEKKSEFHFSESDKNLLELLAVTLGSIISWQDQYSKMQEDAMHDGLTNLLNHKAFIERFAEETNRANRYQHNLVLALLDLDKFKQVNDAFGHLYGDYVIREVARIIKENVRNIDVVGRYGGEEYTILLINTEVEKVIPVVQRIINKIAEFPFSMDNTNVQMTISGGLAEYPKDAEGLNNLINRADEAMYAVKAQGGNNVTVYSKDIRQLNSEPIKDKIVVE